MTASIEISVVVPTFHREALLKTCLTALSRQDFDAQRYEVIVADDGDSRATREVVEQAASSSLCMMRYVPVTGNHGPAAARNTGWRSARGSIIAFTDDDCVPECNWLSAGYRAIQIADAVSGKVIVPLPEVPTDYERDAAGLATAEFVTANCFIRRDVLEQIGGFDERFRMAWREDSDLQFSLLERSARLIRAESAAVVHPIRPANWGVSVRLHRRLAFDALLFKKHPKLYRQRIMVMPIRYYIIALAATVALLGFVSNWPALGLLGFALWCALTLHFCWLRLRNTSRRPSHIAEMLYTSAVIPFVSLYWRIRGAIEHRVVFF